MARTTVRHVLARAVDAVAESLDVADEGEREREHTAFSHPPISFGSIGFTRFERQPSSSRHANYSREVGLPDLVARQQSNVFASQDRR